MAAASAPPAEPSPLPAGHRLGHFELRGVRVDDGAVDSLLYKAWDHQLAGPVALAEYLPQGLAQRAATGTLGPVSADVAPAYAAGLDRFVDEAIWLADTQHPNLVKVLQVLQLQGTAYRVMPWYRGTRLTALRQAMAGPPDEAALRALLEELLGALQALHRSGRVHGAVHPGRILLQPDDHALLLGPEGGPPAASGFQAPEQLDAAAATVGPWTDCHAVAQVVRFCISGQWPGSAGSWPPEPLAHTIERLYAGSPEVHYTPAFLRALDLAASADPARRPQTAAQFLEWLGEPPPGDTSPPIAADDGAPYDADISLAARRAIEQAIASIPPRAERPLSIDLPAAQARRAPGLAPVQVPSAAPTPVPAPPTSPRPDPLESPGLRAPWAEGAARRSRPRWGLAAAAVLAVVVLAGLGAWVMQEPARQWLAGLASPPAARETPASAAAVALPRDAEPASAPVGLTTTPAVDSPASAPLPATEPPAAAPAVVAAAAAPSAAEVVAQAASTPAESTPVTSTPAAVAPAALAPAEAPSPAAVAAPTPNAVTSTSASAPAQRVLSPRQQCGERTQFALYRCMQRECGLARWKQHPQCVRLRDTDEVD